METIFQSNSKTRVDFLKKLPSPARVSETVGFKPEKTLLVYDKRLARNSAVAKWIDEFKFKYPVTSGEGLKEISTFAVHLKKIFKLISPFSNRSLCVLALGGGSVGDFSGFLSSVLKRGVPLIHVPSTLLAAMDSAHGGKTALNVGEFKNQVGSFYPADGVLIIKNLFEGLPSLQLQSAAGELIKTAFISGGHLFERVQKDFKLDLDSIWDFLPEIIEAKYRIVEKDPLEKSGERQVLNLGHSLGHALESYYGLAHGVAVGQGLIFALLWSEHQGYLRGADQWVDFMVERFGFQRPRDFAEKNRPMSRSRLARLIAEDKKLTDARHLNFIFVEEPGNVFRKEVTVESLLTETQRQGWTSL